MTRLPQKDNASLSPLFPGINDQAEQGRLPASATDIPVPTPINSTAQFTMVSTGLNHACALADDGRVYCWGYSNYGQASRYHINYSPSSLAGWVLELVMLCRSNGCCLTNTVPKLHVAVGPKRNVDCSCTAGSHREQEHIYGSNCVWELFLRLAL